MGTKMFNIFKMLNKQWGSVGENDRCLCKTRFASYINLHGGFDIDRTTRVLFIVVHTKSYRRHL